MILKEDTYSKIVIKEDDGKRVVKTFKNDVTWLDSEWAKHAIRITEMYPKIFPQIYSIDIEKRQMTMEYIEGYNLGDNEDFNWNEYEKKAFNVFLNESVLAMIEYSMKYENFIYLDLRLGNILRKNDQFKLVDLDSFVISKSQLEFSFHLGKLYNKLSNITYDFCYRSLQNEFH